MHPLSTAREPTEGQGSGQWPRTPVDLVVFLGVDWDTTGTHHRQHSLTRALARQLQGIGRVLAVERPICPVTGPWRRSAKYIRWLRKKTGVRQESSNLFVYTPFVLLHNILAAWLPGVTPANRRLLQSQLENVARRLGFEYGDLVATIHHPYQQEDIGVARERLLIYDCYDDYLSDSHGRRLADLRRRHAAILREADLVLAASVPLLRSVKREARRTLLLPNAADDGLFHTGACVNTRVPPELEGLPQPIIGFVGRVGDWLDFELLADLAARRPDWTFAFVGPQDSARRISSRAGYAAFIKADNVCLLGPREHSSVPAYMHAFDVCIIPYLLDGQVPSSSPLKLYEYLAAAKPVVSVPISDVRRFEPLIRIASDAVGFESAITELLHDDDGSARQRRLELARQNSWARRAQCVIQAIDQLLQEGPD